MDFVYFSLDHEKGFWLVPGPYVDLDLGIGRHLPVSTPVCGGDQFPWQGRVAVGVTVFHLYPFVSRLLRVTARTRLTSGCRRCTTRLRGALYWARRMSPLSASPSWLYSTTTVLFCHLVRPVLLGVRPSAFPHRSGPARRRSSLAPRGFPSVNSTRAFPRPRQLPRTPRPNGEPGRPRCRDAAAPTGWPPAPDSPPAPGGASRVPAGLGGWSRRFRAVPNGCRWAHGAPIETAIVGDRSAATGPRGHARQRGTLRSCGDEGPTPRRPRLRPPRRRDAADSASGPDHRNSIRGGRAVRPARPRCRVRAPNPGPPAAATRRAPPPRRLARRTASGPQPRRLRRRTPRPGGEPVERRKRRVPGFPGSRGLAADHDRHPTEGPVHSLATASRSVTTFIRVSARSDRCVPKCAAGEMTSFALHRFGLGDHHQSGDFLRGRRSQNPLMWSFRRDDLRAGFRPYYCQATSTCGAFAGALCLITRKRFLDRGHCVLTGQ